MSAPTRGRTDTSAEARAGRLPAAGGEARRGGGPPWMGAAMPAEKAMTFVPSAKRLFGGCARTGPLLIVVLRWPS